LILGFGQGFGFVKTTPSTIVTYNLYRGWYIRYTVTKDYTGIPWKEYVYSSQAYLSTLWSNRPFITDRYCGQVGDVDDNGDVDFRKSTFSKDRHFVFIVTRIVVASVMRLPACGANSVSNIIVTIIHESKLRNFEWNSKAIFHRIKNKEIQSH